MRKPLVALATAVLLLGASACADNGSTPSSTGSSGSTKGGDLTIVRNAFYEQMRRQKRESRALSSRFDPAEALDPQQDARADINDLQHLMFNLPPLLREALLLVGAHELSHEEAAKICNVPVGTMKAWLSRARTALGRMGTPSEPTR